MLGIALAAPGRASSDDVLALESLDGGAVELRAPERGARVLHFWATWCPSCKGELAALASAAQRCEGSGIEVLAVDVGESVEEIGAYLAERPLVPRVLRDPEGRAWRTSGGREMPANLIWTSTGERSWVLGPSTEALWRKRLAALGCAASE